MLEENKSSSIKQKVKKCEEDLIDLELQIEIQEKRLEQLKEESVQPEQFAEADTSEMDKKLAQLKNEPEESNSVLKQVQEDFQAFTQLQE